MTERTTVRLPPELMRRAKRKAAANGTTLTAVIEDSLRHALSDRASDAEIQRRPLPVSTARGGLRPGIDLEDKSMLDKLEGHDWIERLK